MMKFIDFEDSKISKLSLGTVQFGLNYGIANNSGKPHLDDVKAIVTYLYNEGINCFDTAQAYGDSEEILGCVLEDKENLFVVSKLKSIFFLENLTIHVEKSLKNLNINSLFALLLHDSTLLYEWNNAYTDKIKELQQKGLIKYFGVSIYTSRDFEYAIKNDAIQIIQIPFNIFDQRALQERWFDIAKENNKLIFIRSVFLQGLLLMDTLPPYLQKAKEEISKLKLLSEEFGLSKVELALSFAESVGANSIILFGCETLEQAKENIKTFNTLKTLNPSQIQHIVDLFGLVDESIYNPTKWNNNA